MASCPGIFSLKFADHKVSFSSFIPIYANSHPRVSIKNFTVLHIDSNFAREWETECECVCLCKYVIVRVCVCTCVCERVRMCVEIENEKWAWKSTYFTRLKKKEKCLKIVTNRTNQRTKGEKYWKTFQRLLIKIRKC